LVNGASISNGVLEKKQGITSRTWLLTEVKTIDLMACEKEYCSGDYGISVVLPGE
jgi:hypothetical protein